MEIIMVHEAMAEGGSTDRSEENNKGGCVTLVDWSFGCCLGHTKQPGEN